MTHFVILTLLLEEKKEKYFLHGCNMGSNVCGNLIFWARMRATNGAIYLKDASYLHFVQEKTRKDTKNIKYTIKYGLLVIHSSYGPNTEICVLLFILRKPRNIICI